MIKSYPEIISKTFDDLKLVLKKNKADKQIIKIKDKLIGEDFIYILGPCAIENKEMYENTAKFLIKHNIGFIRGGAHKLRTTPYTYEGLGNKGLDIIKEISDKYKLVSFSEVPGEDEIDIMKDKVDVLVVGARNMQNVSMLKKLGKVKNPIMLKRSPGATIMELLASAEFILNEGNPNVILCERGIRTFETHNRYTLDLAGAIALKNITKLPVIIDPSHAAGRRELILPLARSIKASGVDGIMVEMHENPEKAQSDKMQAIDFKEAERMVSDCEKIKLY